MIGNTETGRDLDHDAIRESYRRGSAMNRSSSNTQVYSPLGSYVVEQHDRGDDRRTRSAPGEANSSIQQYYPLHSVAQTPSRLRVLWNIMLHRQRASQH